MSQKRGFVSAEKGRIAVVLLVVFVVAGFAPADEQIEVMAMIAPAVEPVEVMAMASPSIAPSGVASQIVSGPLPMSAVMLSGVPTSSWTNGCSATSAGMIFGYYDRTGYANMYTGPANGGVAPLTNLGGQCSIISTRNGFDGRAVKGHVGRLCGPNDMGRQLQRDGSSSGNGSRDSRAGDCQPAGIGYHGAGATPATHLAVGCGQSGLPLGLMRRTSLIRISTISRSAGSSELRRRFYRKGRKTA